MGWFTSSSTVQKQQLHAALSANLEDIQSRLSQVNNLRQELTFSQDALSGCAAKAATLGASIAANYGQRGQAPVHLSSINNQLQALQQQAATQLRMLQSVEKNLIVARNDIQQTQNMINMGRTQRLGYQSATKLVQQALAGKHNAFKRVEPSLSSAEQQLQHIQGQWSQKDIEVTTIERKHNTLNQLEQNLVNARKGLDIFLHKTMTELLGCVAVGQNLSDGQNIKMRAANMLDDLEELRTTAQTTFNDIDLKLATLRNDLKQPQLNPEPFDATVKQVESLFQKLTSKMNG